MALAWTLAFLQSTTLLDFFSTLNNRTLCNRFDPQQGRSSIEEAGPRPKDMASSPTSTDALRVLLVRGGALTPYSGLGGAHRVLVEHHKAGRFPDVSMLSVLEYPEQTSALGRLRYRWSKHPKTVRTFCKEHLGPNDVVHITDQEQAHLVPARLPGRPKIMVTVHDLFHLFPHTVSVSGRGVHQPNEHVQVGDASPGLARRFDLSKLRAGLGRADLLVCDSEHTRRMCSEAYPDVKAITVPLGLETERYAPTGPQPKNTKFNLLYVGSADPRKRLRFLVELLKVADDDFRQTSVFHVVGDRSASTASLLQDLDMEVVVHSRLDDDAMMELRHKADLLLFPSAAEGFGYPPVESMASGCQVLCSDLPAHNELMPEGSCLPAGDVEAWSNALIGQHEAWKASEEKVVDERLMQHAQRFSSAVFVENMSAAYRSL